ncbi:MAG: GNAT family N-acetyltransferase [Mycobacterium sp.]|nr:GNAT family N-acetyltransferase [Mycobacterium sp.]
MTPALRLCRGADLDATTLYELLKLRVEVFVVEQNCPYPELDGRDLLRETRHFWLQNARGEVISTLRLMEEFPEGRTVFRIGRVCTAQSERGQGHTGRLMAAALAEVGELPCRISAQTYLAGMYARHGFTQDGPEFLEDAIAHIPMLRAPMLRTARP